jgi:hypothetical protein
MGMPRVWLPADPRWAWAVLFLGRPVPSATVLRIRASPDGHAVGLGGAGGIGIPWWLGQVAGVVVYVQA